MNVAAFITVFVWIAISMTLLSNQEHTDELLNRRLNCLEDGGVTSTTVNIQIDKTTVVFHCMKNEQVLYSWDK